MVASRSSATTVTDLTLSNILLNSCLSEEARDIGVDRFMSLWVEELKS